MTSCSTAGWPVLEGDDNGGLVAHAAHRWARVVLAVKPLNQDPRTLAAWGRAVGVSPGALKIWCRNAGVTAKDSLDLARLLRGASYAQQKGWNAYELFDIVDPRTLTRLLSRAGISALPLPPPPVLLVTQKLVTAPILLTALRDALSHDASVE